jgi:hypothetical protein
MYQREIDPAFMEVFKLGFENVKQLTTLNAGSIVIIGTFLADIFPTKDGTLAVGPGLKFLIAAAFVFFGLSLIFSAYAMYAFPRVVRNLLEQRSVVTEARLVEELRVFARRLLPFPFFTAGLICFGAAVLLNLYR